MHIASLKPPAWILACLVPAVFFGHSSGPPPRVTGAPGDNPRACMTCHSGSAANSGTGSVKILLQGGAFYIPGVRQRISVQVGDSNQGWWGLEVRDRRTTHLEREQAGQF